jgi:[acyl-carrier-protein] S-malonyltransferase
MTMLDGVETTVGLFPGQGGYRTGVLRDRWTAGDATVREVFQTIDKAARAILGTEVTPRIFIEDSPTPEHLLAHDPEILQLAIFGVSVVCYRLLELQGVEPSVLLGHSLGEFAALTCAGAYHLSDASEVLCHRVAAVARAGDTGGMLSLSCDSRTAEHIIALTGDPDVVIAGDNGPSHVLSGPRAALGRAEALAAAAGVTAVRLLAPVAFHSPALAGPRDELRRQADRYPQQPLRKPVYSPIVGRFYRDADNLVQKLADHLVTPVRFGPAISRFYDAGARIFVEIGAGSALSGLVRATCPLATILSMINDLDGVTAYLRAPTTTNATSTPVAAVPPTPAHEDEPVPATARVAAVSPSRSEVLGIVRAIYAKTLEYPEEVLVENAELEADLGVDSLKRVQLLTLLREHFELGPPPEDFEMSAYRTVGSVVDLVHTSLTAARV